MRILGSNIPINRSLLEYMHQLKPKELVVYLVLIIHVLEYKRADWVCRLDVEDIMHVTSINPKEIKKALRGLREARFIKDNDSGWMLIDKPFLTLQRPPVTGDEE